MLDYEVMLLGNNPQSKELEQAWTHVVEYRVVDRQKLRLPIALSWERCLARDLDPLDSFRMQKHPSPEMLLENQRPLLHAASQCAERLLKVLRNDEFLVTLSDADGFVLGVFGGEAAQETARQHRILVGMKSSEEVLGTTAPGICLHQQEPIQVYGFEHYYQAFHGWCCSSAPIMTAQRVLLGVLTATTTNSRRHSPQILSLVHLAAEAIENALELQSFRTKFFRNKYSLASLVDATPQPMLVFNENDTLAHFNNAAVKVLGVRTNDLMGKSASDLLEDGLMKNVPPDDTPWKEITFRVAEKKLSISAKIRRLSNSETMHLGTVVLLRQSVNAASEPALPVRFSFRHIVHASQKITDLISEAKAMATQNHGILLEGESGTGKEVLAQAIHHESLRANGPFVALNCAALPRELIQSELFGYEGGAFTGANREGQIGKFEQADGGTILLDEIGDMPFEAQANLLRVLQEKSLVRIGGTKPRILDVRVIAATNLSLSQLVRDGRFRRDLFYRLSVLTLSIPPLRERKRDLAVLVEHFVEKHGGGRIGFAEIEFAPEVWQILETYDWPGNIRELENAVIVFLTKMKNGRVTVQNLPSSLADMEVPSAHPGSLGDMEYSVILRALTRCKGNVTQTAKQLGVCRATLYRKLKRYEIDH